MLDIIDYKLKIRMPIANKEELATAVGGFTCLTGSSMSDLVIHDDETGEELPYLEYIK